MSRRIRSALTAGMVAASLALQPADAGTPRDTLVLAANIGGMITLDPAAINESITNHFMASVCDPLVGTDPDDASRLVAGIAERWTASEDLKTYTFHIRKGLKFPSGNPATAHDLAWSIKRSLSLNLAYAKRLRDWDIHRENLDRVLQVPDDHTLVVTLERPWAATLFPYAFTDFRAATMLDRQEVLKHEVDGDLGNKWLTTHTACLGPFRVTTWRPQEVLILERNDTWWGPRPEIKKIIVQHVPESGAQRLLLEKGDVDIARNIDPADYEALKSNPNTRVDFAPSLLVRYVMFNLKDARFKDRPKLTQAFRYLLDYDVLANTVLKDYGVVRQSPVPIGAFGALPADDKPYRLDLAKARQLLAEAGFPTGFEAELVTQNSFPYPDLAQHLQANAEKVGVTLKITQMVSSQLFKKLRSRDFQITVSGWGFNYPDANNVMMVHAYNVDNSDAAQNTSSLAWRASWDPGEAFHSAIRAAQTERDPQRRIRIYQELQKRHMAESPILYIVQVNEGEGHHKSLKQLKRNVMQTFYAIARK